MRIFILGGTGFIGTALSSYLLKLGHQVIISVRSFNPPASTHKNLSYVYWSNDAPPPLTDLDAIINLAGEPLNAKRWTSKRKVTLTHSRLNTTEILTHCLQTGYYTPKVFVSGSAMGIYDDCGEAPLTEASLIPEVPKTFTSLLARAWEDSATLPSGYLSLPNKPRTILLRTGIVLGDGGMLKALKPLYHLGLGGPILFKNPYVPWIHLEDIVRLILFAVQNDAIEGPLNACAPNPVPLNTLMKAFAIHLKRPFLMPVPAFMLYVVLGQRAQLVLSSQKGLPEKALQSGFEFNYPTIASVFQSF